MSSIANTLSYGPQKLFLVANESILFVRNPGHTVGTDATIAAASNTGTRENRITIITDNGQTINIPGGVFGFPINDYKLREEANIDGEIERFSYGSFIPETHTYTGFRLGGTVNPNATYKACIISSSNFHHFDHTDQRLTEWASVTTPSNVSGWTPEMITVYLFYDWYYDKLRKTAPRQNLINDVEVLLVTGTEFTPITTASDNYKASPTSSNYNALLAAFNSAKTGMLADGNFNNFISNPTISNATTLSGTRNYIVARTQSFGEILTIGFNGYFKDINNTVTVTEYLPVPATGQLLRGGFGVGTYMTGMYHCAGKTNLSPEFTYGYPYCKVQQGAEYGELHIRYNQSSESSTNLYARSKYVLDMVIYVRMDQASGGTAYTIKDADVGSAITGTIFSPTTFTTFINDLGTVFPEFNL